MFYSCIKFLSIGISTYIQFYTNSDRYHFRGRDKLTLEKNFARTTNCKAVFFKDMWNKLPLSVCQAPTPVLRRVQGTSCYQDMTDF